MVSSIQQKCVLEIDHINALIEQKVKVDTLGKVALLLSLLILYILANMRDDREGMSETNDQMSALLHSIGKETQLGHVVKDLLQSIRQDPTEMNQDTLDFLEKLAKMVQKS